MALSIRNKIGSRSNAVWVACCLAGTSQIALVALLIGIITKDSLLHDSLVGLAWAASIVHVVTLIVLPAAAFVFSLRRTTGLIQTIFGALSILLAVLGAILSIYVFAQVWSSLAQHKNEKGVDLKTVRDLTQAGFAVWSIAVVAQATLYALLFWPANDHKDSETSTEEGTARSSPVRSLKRSLSVQMAALSPPSTPRFIRTTEPELPAFSIPRSNSATSLRQSMDRVVRPMTSKTKLLLQKAQDSYSLNSTRKTSLETIGQEDDFGDWDTTSPDDVVPFPEELYVRPTARTRLETIPGSRPASPANPLDGPFQDSVTEDDRRAATPSRHVLASQTSDDNSLRLSTQSSRSDSIADDQKNIHPLFRSESPAPAPAIRSTNTNVYGHPQGGKFVAAEDDFEILGLPRTLHSSHSHCAESASPLSPASRQNSFRQQSPTEAYGLARPSPAFAMGTEPKG
ncbi:hypothetical protein LTR09_003297 [Extremus antarcticus]|uniref:Uncharacterized protein n=1 Tax=Extremus antarcticus TaxID=702011 RepID=A0AAJ0GEN3_9PEZI|nr:hypothetical protein LTR09_003297 [Extremus antarcticus]